MVIVAQISYADVAALPELLTEYAEECRIHEIGRAEPQWDIYAALEASGKFRVYGAFMAGRLIGFSGVLMAVMPHYGHKMATVESVFVSKLYRDGTAAARLFQAIEAEACAAGCKAILYSAMSGSDLEAVLAKRYPRTNSVFCKPLG